MTFEDRIRALEPLGFSTRQTRFVVTVALHGGYCLRRHYAAFAGIGYGRVVRDFLDSLVTRQLAQRVEYRTERGYLYHLHAKSIYRALHQDNNRNRRRASPERIAIKLMLLDFALTRPDVEWLVTEQDKVVVFSERFGVPRADLPQRAYASHYQRAAPTARYFVHKLPIYLAGDPRARALRRAGRGAEPARLGRVSRGPCSFAQPSLNVGDRRGAARVGAAGTSGMARRLRWLPRSCRVTQPAGPRTCGSVLRHSTIGGAERLETAICRGFELFSGSPASLRGRVTGGLVRPLADWR